jgi:hypothetical protein
MGRLHLTLLSLLFIAPCIGQQLSADNATIAPEAGTWSGEWRGQNGLLGGAMQFEIDVKGGQVTGRARATIRGDCSNQWEPLVGLIKEERVLASYNLGGRCGKVDLVLWMASDGTMTGTWKSEFPSNGTYNLRKK